MDRFAALSTFVTIADKGSFAAAAESLRMSRAMVTKHIADLEAHLGARLLNRTTRRLSLTEAGADFLDRAREILSLLEAAEMNAAAGSKEPSGVLRLNAPMSFGVLHLAHAVAAYQKQCPKVSIELLLNDRVVDVVEEGFDLAVRIGHLKDSSLVARRLAPCRMAVAASPEYLQRHGRPAEPADLKDHTCLIYSYAAEADKWRFERDGKTETVKVAGSMRSNNGEALTRAAIQGAGIVLQPTFILASTLREGTLEILLSDWEVPPLTIHAVWPPSRHLSAKVRGFIDFLVDRYSSEPEWERDL